MLDLAVAAIGWEPEIRGALTVILSVAILCGSVYLIVATNTGARLGFLISFTGLMGWMLLMGIIWTIYGIGLVGDSPTWQVSEVVVGDLAAAETEQAQSLDDWRSLPEGDGSRGEAQATVDSFLVENEQEVFGGEAPELTSIAAFAVGGKSRLEGDNPCSIHRPSTYDGCWDRVVHKLRTTFREVRHGEHLALIQLQALDTGADGEVTDQVDPSAPLVSVILERDLGNRRFPPIMVTLFSGILFTVGAWQLHHRDKRAMAARAAVGV